AAAGGGVGGRGARLTPPHVSTPEADRLRGTPSGSRRVGRYPVVRGTAWSGTATTATGTPRAAACAAAPRAGALTGFAPGPGVGPDGGPGGVNGVAAQPASPVSFGFPGPPSSPPAPRPFDPVWQLECRSPLASGSGVGVAEAALTHPTGIANEAAATTLTSIFFITLPN